MACNSCGSVTVGCGCQDTSLTTIPVALNCVNGSPCGETYPSNCIQYSRMNVNVASLNLALIAPYNIPDILGVTNTSVGPVTIQFPPANLMTGNLVQFCIKDEAFNASVNNITLIPGVGTKIEGLTSNMVINNNGRSVMFYYDGISNYFIKSAS